MRTFTLSFLICCSIIVVKAQIHYPATKTTADADTYFGITYKDPYRWLENMKDPEVVKWFKSQADLTNSVTNNITGRNELISEWKNIDKLQPVERSAITCKGGRYFYRERQPTENVSKLFCKTGLTGTPQLLFDPLNYIKGKTLTLQEFAPSGDGKFVAISYAYQGAEVAVTKVLNVDTRKFLTDSLYPTGGLSATWAFDNKSFMYLSIKSADNKDPGSRLNSKTKLHKLNTTMAADVDFFSNVTYPELKITPKAYPVAYLDIHSPNYVFANIGTVANELVSYYAPINEFNSGKIHWKTLSTEKNKLVKGFAVIGDKAYSITYNNAKNYKLVTTTLKNPDWEHAETIEPEKPGLVMESFTALKDFLIIIYTDGINSHVFRYNLKTKATSSIKTPISGDAIAYTFSDETNEVILNICSWTQIPTEFNYNAVTGAYSASAFNKPPVLPAVYQQLRVKEVEVKGHDGTMIPLSIIYRAGTKLDGSNVCLMDSYGAYGTSMIPIFNKESALAVRGAVIAVPHVRGGGEKGEAWYKAGYKTTKPNTWKDFISCAEYLIAKGYTSAGKLAGTGTSAGGVLISRAITERPDLFAAAVCNVGCANAMRLEFSANGPVNIPEFGTVKDKVECKALFEMDGVKHVLKGTKYPAVICVGGWNDSRVIPWQPAKFAAALQNSTTSGKPVLMKVNYDNGHFTEDKNVTYANFADQYAFVMWQCGLPGFKPKS